MQVQVIRIVQYLMRQWVVHVRVTEAHQEEVAAVIRQPITQALPVSRVIVRKVAVVRNSVRQLHIRYHQR